MEHRNSPAGLLARYYSARHVVGHYRSCGVTGRYILSDTQNLSNILKYALAKNIIRHPSLCYSITPESSTSEAELIRLKTINWSDVVNFCTSDLPVGKEDAALAKELGVGHEWLWSDCNKPTWKIIVLEHENASVDYGLRVVDIAFVSHHAIVDGISAGAFHKSLLAFLQEACTLQNLESDWPVIIPSDISKPQQIEDLVKYTPNSNSSATETDPGSEAWTALPPSLPSISEYNSRVSIITIPSTTLQVILKNCRLHQTTITGLLHSLIVIQLSKLVPESQCFNAVTPYSLRPFSHLPSTEIANHVSYITSSWPTSLIEKARSCFPNTTEENMVIRAISKQYQSEISNELGRIPTHGPQMLNNVSAIQDFTTYCEEGFGARRSHTYELSNIGVVTIPALPEPSNLTLEKLIFTQCGMVVGPAIGFGVVSLAGGPMVVSLYWQQEIVEEEFMEELRSGLEDRLLGFTS